jgi:predicted CopG family antitoxin
MSEKTTIQISTETWRELNLRKESPSDTFDAVIQRLLDPSDDDA